MWSLGLWQPSCHHEGDAWSCGSYVVTMKRIREATQGLEPDPVAK